MRYSKLLPILLLAAIPVVAQESPYADFTSRNIKALSPDDITGYLEGQGMGFAMAAELNSHPGPKHVLELASDLALTDDQERRTREIFDAMHATAVRLGRELVETEAALDAGFAAGEIDEDGLRSLLRELGRIRADLQFAHLRAHLEMKAVLTDEQIVAYDRLRGYGGGNPHPHGHHHHGDHPG